MNIEIINIQSKQNIGATHEVVVSQAAFPTPDSAAKTDGLVHGVSPSLSRAAIKSSDLGINNL